MKENVFVSTCALYTGTDNKFTLDRTTPRESVRFPSSMEFFMLVFVTAICLRNILPISSAPISDGDDRTLLLRRHFRADLPTGNFNPEPSRFKRDGGSGGGGGGAAVGASLVELMASIQKMQTMLALFRGTDAAPPTDPAPENGEQPPPPPGDAGAGGSVDMAKMMQMMMLMNAMNSGRGGGKSG
ncbi:hypothetical protein BV898_17608 [Hypsibius exemplaris]|uniref:Uncharacterized protein n=1 Tax=Hypsibius exemplaris TaxID=2072580 RepID=A0A9X6NH68_HYPEX|nr:hypothetical protein BV898_17608 [Hypsibius exemplaris]